MIQKRSHLNWTCALATILTSLAQGGHAQDAHAESFKTLVELCAELPAGKEHIEKKIVAYGWAQASDPAVLVDLMASTTFNFRHSLTNKEDLAMSLENAFFMAASMLGNSALPQGQKAYVSGDLVVGIIGITLDKPGLPYCVIGSAHDELGRLSAIVPLEATEAHGDLAISEGVVHSGSLGASNVNAAYVSSESVIEAIERLGVTELPYAKRLPPDEAAARFRPFIAVSAPIVPTEGK